MPDYTEKPRRGRPASLSREEILQAGLLLLEQDPAAVTLNGVARQLGRAPMTLYTHVRDRDDLLLGISELVLGKLELKLDTDHWEEQVRQWAAQVREHLEQYPQVLRLIGDERQIPVKWLELQARLVGVLHTAGLREQCLGRTADLICQSVVFDAIHAQALSGQVEDKSSDTLAALSDTDRKYIQMVIDSAPGGHHSLLDFTLDKLLKDASEYLEQP